MHIDIITEVFALYSSRVARFLPLNITTDQDRQFEPDLFLEFALLLEIKRYRTTP